jgi:hypothetical protein
MQHFKKKVRVGAIGVSLFSLILAFSAGTVTAQTPQQGGTTGNPPQQGGTTGRPPQQGGTTGSPPQQGGTTVAGDCSKTLCNPLKFKSLEELLNAVLKAAIQIGTIILTLALIYTGFKFVAARGNEEKISQAKTALFWTIIGGFILLGATAIQQVITQTVNSLTV